MFYEKTIIPGFENKAIKETEKKIEVLKKRRSSIVEALRNNKNSYEKKEAPKGIKGESYRVMNEQVDIINEIDIQIKDLENTLTDKSFDIGIGYNVDPYVPSELGYSIANNNGRVYIGRNLEHIPLDPYDESYIASEFAPGVDPRTNFSDLVTMLNVEESDSIMFDSEICFGAGAKDDDRANIEKAIAHIHDVGMINAENKKAFEILRGAKSPITISAHDVNYNINCNLSAKAKLNAVIIVNKDGFAKIDGIDTDGGDNLVKRVGDKFMYREKYVIQEVSNDVLPNNADGSTPIIIGDMSIVKFFVMRDDSLEKDEFGEFKIRDRHLRRELIALSTISNGAYIHGTLD